MTGIGYLSGTVKHYDWGGHDFIPSLLQVDNLNKQPFGEFWLGVHQLADCTVVIDGQKTLLRDLVASDKTGTLGSFVSDTFGDLPYLLKILDVKQMLSIQVHPSKAVAEKEFDRENADGIPVTSPKRNYKDKNHKPELIVALNEFWLLHGFKSEAGIRQVLQETSELNRLIPVFDNQGYGGLYKTVMEMPQAGVDAMLTPLLDRIVPLYKENRLAKSHPDFWAARAAIEFAQGSGVDRGIFSIYFFNLLQLKKGEGIFQAAGVPHAYLEGLNVEIMANSDNVLRGGLTSKHIDVVQLLKNTTCEPIVPNILRGEQHGVENIYVTPAPDFQLSSFDWKEGDSYSFIAPTCEIILAVAGRVQVTDGTHTVVLETGNPAAVVFASQTVTVKALSPSLFFKASVPVLNKDH
jgi:mannose-6-phosphate isomerase